jgi:hypothetical protein
MTDAFLWPRGTRVGLVLFAVQLAGCAPYPDQIAPANVSSAHYQGQSCQQLASQRNDVVGKLNAANSKQTYSATNDAIAAVFSPLTYGVGIGDEGNFETQIASLKGQYDALTRAGQSDGCFPEG